MKMVNLDYGRGEPQEIKLFDVGHTKGYYPPAMGYGRKLQTVYKAEYSGKLYRVYCTCFSNAGTCWFIAKGVKHIVS